VYVFGRVFEGLAQSGGAIAWNIGHLHFAEDDKAELYMGIHVSLTGLRGLVAPFLGTFLFHLIGAGVFAVGFIISFVGYVIFSGLARDERRQKDRGFPVETDVDAVRTVEGVSPSTHSTREEQVAGRRS
jgi:hypothetical protein